MLMVSSINVIFPNYDEKCESCKGSNYTQNPKTYEYVCRKCGLVIEEKPVDFTGGTNQFDQEIFSDKLFPLGSVIPYENRDFQKVRFTVKQRKKAKQLRKHNARDYVRRKRDMMMVWMGNYLSRIEADQGLRDEARTLLLRVINDSNENPYRYTNLEAVIPAVIRIACKLRKIPMSFKETIDLNEEIKRKQIAYYFKLIMWSLGIKTSLNFKEYIISLKKYITKASNALNISEETQNLAFNILDNIREKKKFSGLNPRGIAGGILYITCRGNNEKRTQKKLAKILDVTEVTLRSRIKEINLLLEQKN